MNYIEDLKPPRRFIHLAFVGASGSGKSTLQRLFKEECAAAGFWGYAFPVRTLSRSPRPDDRDEENRSIGPEAFDAAQKRGEFWLTWERDVGGAAPSKYGFLRNDIFGVNVLAGNDAFVLQSASILPSSMILDDVLVIQVVAPGRVDRLAARSPHLIGTAEWEARIADNDDAVARRSDLRVINAEGQQDSAARALVQAIIRRVAVAKTL